MPWMPKLLHILRLSISEFLLGVAARNFVRSAISLIHAQSGLNLASTEANGEDAFQLSVPGTSFV